MKRILGISDDESSCTCCGKTGLKRVVYVENTKTGQVSWFGTTCATRNTGVLFGEIKKMAKAAKSKREKEILKALEPELNELKAAEKRWRSFKETHKIKGGVRHWNLAIRFTREATRKLKARRDELERLIPNYN